MAYQPPAPTRGDLASRLDIMTAKVVEKGLDFHLEKIWGQSDKDLDKYAANHSAGIRLKMESFRMFYNKVVPSQGKLTVKYEGGGQGITAEDLVKMGIPVDTLKQLANMTVVKGEVVSREEEDAESETQS